MGIMPNHDNRIERTFNTVKSIKARKGRLMAQTCKGLLRESDLIGRYGGEEFIVFLPEADKEQALQVAERIRRAVEALRIPRQEEYLSVTISIGIALLQEDKHISKDMLIRNADQAMYEAKKRGRNRVYFQ
jgi:diguanylate cyclase (GGDEF)-like protein